MPITPAAVANLLDQLEAAHPITHRKMFGGIGIYADGVFFSVIDNDRLYFKVDATNEPAYLAEESEQWVIEGASPAPMPYREVPAKILADPASLAEWIAASVEVANRKKTKPKKR